jgi:hypothetical protein
MKIKWKEAYFPHFVDELGAPVKIRGTFRCKFQSRDLICTMVPTEYGGGHGDPSFTYYVASFMDDATLVPVDVDGFVDVVG